jgi:hypothetical protein
MHPSAQAFSKNALCVPAMNQWLKETTYLNTLMKSMFKTEWPESFERFDHAFKSARLNKLNPGPWHGKAVVWKSDSHVHADTKDSEECPTSCVPIGQYTRGEMELFDMKTKIAYESGTVVAGLFTILGHRSKDWAPTPPPTVERGKEWQMWGLTPGRFTIVSFFHENVLKKLEKRGRGWGQKTLLGHRKVLPAASKRQKPIPDTLGSKQNRREEGRKRARDLEEGEKNREHKRRQYNL